MVTPVVTIRNVRLEKVAIVVNFAENEKTSEIRVIKITAIQGTFVLFLKENAFWDLQFLKLQGLLLWSVGHPWLL